MMFDERDLVCFAEGQLDGDPQAQTLLLAEYARNPDMRRRVLELRRDLYRVEMQIPEVNMRPEAILEINRLAEAWIKVRVERKQNLQYLRLGREQGLWLFVFTLVIFLAAVLLIRH